jgi:hypothetical protein
LLFRGDIPGDDGREAYQKFKTAKSKENDWCEQNYVLLLQEKKTVLS